METESQLIIEAAKIVGTQAALAREIGESPAFINHMAKGIRPIPDRLCPKIEKATGGIVCRKRLRPGTYHEMWPELAEAS